MSDVPYDIEAPYLLRDPLDMDDARKASREVTRLRREAENSLRGAVQAAAEAEAAYRMALATAIVVKRSEGPATTAVDEARGSAQVAGPLETFRLAEGMVDAAKERVRGVEGERSLLKSLIDASARFMVNVDDPGPPDKPTRSEHFDGEGEVRF